MNILRLRRNILVALLFVCGLLFFATRTVFAADEAMTLGAGTKGAGPVAYWNFDEAGGPTAYDSSGSSNDGTLNAGGTGSNTSASQMWYPQGKFGGCLEFDGTNDRVGISYTNPVSATSVVAWFKRLGTPAGGYHIITGGGSIEISIPESTGAIRTGVTTTTQGRKVFNSGSGLVDGNWHHVAFTYDGAALKSYIDGEETASNPVSGNLSGTAAEIGRYLSDSYACNGLIDEVKIYGRALSADEIRQDYNAGAAALLGGGTAVSYDPWGGDPPVAWWSLDENTGITAYDRSGSGNDGALGGDGVGTDVPTWAHGKYGPALSFDGDGDWVDVGSSNDITGDNLQTITISAWIKSTDTASGYPVSIKRAAGSPSTLISICLNTGGVGQLGFMTRNFANTAHPILDYAGSYNDGEWHHVVAVVDDLTRTLYIDGIQRGTDEQGMQSVTGNTDVAAIGAFNGGQLFFDGLIDEVKIYDYARTQAQVAWDYNKGKPVGWWKLDEKAAGQAVDTTAGAIRDDSGSGNHGTASATTFSYATGKYGRCLSFDGNDYVDCGNINAADGLTNMTVSLWAYSTNFAQNGMLIMKNPVNAVWEFYFETSVLRWRGGGTSGTLSVSSLPSNNNWHHFTVVQGGTTATMYIDGQVAGTDTVNAIGTSSENVNIGRYSGGYYFNGLIDDVRIYNYARTPLQILEDYNEGAAAHLGN